ncbi:MAG TPA: PEGA domain-containing protein, partial [Kofleriaceae bacterium]|nr:PEGA domain-containing protein [Kofleriaceae bacterium]
PLASLTGDTAAPRAGKLEAALAAELAKAGLTVIAPADVTARIKAAKQPALRACDGDAACLTELGKLVGASMVVAGEVGGLGDVQVVYLELLDAGTGQEVRRTQAPLGGSPTEVRAAVIRLVDPARDVGTLQVTAPIDGAVVYVDGQRVGRTPMTPVTLAVGPHALRVTHPDARDFVRFVDIDFEQTTSIDADLARFEAVDTAVSATGATSAAVVRGAPRGPHWYRRWWAVAGFTAVVLGGAVIAGTALAADVPADASGTVTPP